MKYLLALTLIISFTLTSSAQKPEELKKFESSFSKSFYPGYLMDNDSSVFSVSLLIVQVGKKYSIDSVYFSDSAPKWQVDELKKVKKELDVNSLQTYAKRKAFTGKLVIPIIIKSEIVKDLNIYPTYKTLFRINSKLLAGNVRFEDCIVITAGEAIID